MRDVSYAIAVVAGLALLLAAAAWFKIGRNPKGDLAVGGGGKPQTKRPRRASTLLAIALALSGLAVVFAIIAWFGELLNN